MNETGSMLTLHAEDDHAQISGGGKKMLQVSRTATDSMLKMFGVSKFQGRFSKSFHSFTLMQVCHLT